MSKHVKINGVTFVEPEAVHDGSGTLIGHMARELMADIGNALYLCDLRSTCLWPLGLAANLTMAALLGCAAEIGYDQGVDDMFMPRDNWGRTPGQARRGPYPEKS